MWRNAPERTHISTAEPLSGQWIFHPKETGRAAWHRYRSTSPGGWQGDTCMISACQCLRRRGADPCLAIATWAVSPSARRKASAPRSWFSPLNDLPALSPVSASLRPSRVVAHDSGGGVVRYAFTAEDSHGRFRVKWLGSSAHQKLRLLFRYPRSEPYFMTWLVPHQTKLTSGRHSKQLHQYPAFGAWGSGGRDHSFTRLFKPVHCSVPIAWIRQDRLGIARLGDPLFVSDRSAARPEQR